MNAREKVMVAAGCVLVLAVVAWKLLGPGGSASAGDGTTIDGAIAQLQQAAQVKDSVGGLIRELGIEIPKNIPAEQESQIRVDLARKAQECNILVISQKGIESSARGNSVKTVQMLQYRLDLYGQFDSFMKFINALEKSPIPYVVREAQFENSPKAPMGGDGQGGQDASQGGGDPNAQNAAMLAGMRGRGGRRGGMMRGAEGGGGPQGQGQQQPNGRVHVTMRVQSYLFPSDLSNTRVAASTTSKAAPTSATQQGAGGGGTHPAAKPVAEHK